MFLRLTADVFQHSTKSILISFSRSACPSLGFSQILFYNPVQGLGDKEGKYREIKPIQGPVVLQDWTERWSYFFPNEVSNCLIMQL